MHKGKSRQSFSLQYPDALFYIRLKRRKLHIEAGKALCIQWLVGDNMFLMG